MFRLENLKYSSYHLLLGQITPPSSVVFMLRDGNEMLIVRLLHGSFSNMHLLCIRRTLAIMVSTLLPAGRDGSFAFLDSSQLKQKQPWDGTISSEVQDT